MARFVSLKSGRGWTGCVAVAGLGIASSLSFGLRAADAVPMPTQGQPVYPSLPSPAPAKTPAAPSTAINAAPVASAQPPLKMKLLTPGGGEVNVPTPDELNMRETLERLAKLSDEEIHADLAQWPDYGKMSLRDQGLMLVRIQDFRDFRSRVAMQKARDLGLVTLTPDQKAHFEKAYWEKRIRMDHDLVKQFGPVFTARQQKMDEELAREFPVVTGSIALGPKPSIPPPANKSATTNTVTTPKAPVQPVTQGQK